jgi:hypothetical protein
MRLDDRQRTQVNAFEKIRRAIDPWQWLFLLPLFGVTAAQGGEFQNLGFESAGTNNLERIYPDQDSGFGTTADLLPGWNLLFGTASVTGLNYNDYFSLGATKATVFNARHPAFAGMGASGDYGVYFSETSLIRDRFTLVQVGTIPSSAKILSYRYYYAGFDVEIDGQKLVPVTGGTFSPVPTMATYDVSSFAGQTVELRLSAAELPSFFLGSANMIDDIAFSVPEPSTGMLLTAGGAIVSIRYFVAARLGLRRSRYRISSLNPNPARAPSLAR